MKLLSFILISLSGWIHPLHVSVTEIEMDKKDKALEIMMRVFVDDLEQSFRKKYNHPDLNILNPKYGLTLDQMMASYLQDHFKIVLDGKPQAIKYLGHEIDGDAFVFYNEASAVKKWQTIQVHNNILIEIHEDQSNLVHVTVDEVVKSLRLTQDNPQDKLTFSVK